MLAFRSNPILDDGDIAAMMDCKADYQVGRLHFGVIETPPQFTTIRAENSMRPVAFGPLPPLPNPNRRRPPATRSRLSPGGGILRDYGYSGVCFQSGLRHRLFEARTHNLVL